MREETLELIRVSYDIAKIHEVASWIDMYLLASKALQTKRLRTRGYAGESRIWDSNVWFPVERDKLGVGREAHTFPPKLSASEISQSGGGRKITPFL